MVWRLPQAPNGTLYAATGHRGRLYRIDKSGKSTQVWTAEQPEIFAIAIDGGGAVYAAGSPDGKVYRIENGKAEVFSIRTRYVWALAVGPDGALYAGTGDRQHLPRQAANQERSLLRHRPDPRHGLSFDAQGRLLAGTEPNGILYRVTAKDKAFALYDANLPEIRAIGTGPDGSIYAAGLGGSVARRGQAATQTQQAATGAGAPSVTISVAVTADASAAKPAPRSSARPSQGRRRAAAAGRSQTPGPSPRLSIVVGR